MLKPDSAILNSCSYTDSLAVYSKVTQELSAILWKLVLVYSL